jgi:multiple sugar transport system permease protein
MITFRQAHKQRTNREKSNLRAFYLFIFPILINWLIFLLAPLVYSFYLSLTHYDVMTQPEFAGLQNYLNLATDERFITALKNTFFFVVFFVPFAMIMSLTLAMLLNQLRRGKGLFRSIFYLPAIVPIVSKTLVFTLLFNFKFGLVNAILRYVGLTPLAWTTDPNLLKPALIILGLWSLGADMLIFLAGLQSIPKEYYEAASIDGASGWNQFWLITLPLLSPTTLFIFLLGIIGAFQVFTTAYVLTGGTGGARDAALFVVLYLYNQGFKLGNFGYASAIAWVLAIIIIFFTIVSLRISERRVFYESSSQENQP